MEHSLDRLADIVSARAADLFELRGLSQPPWLSDVLTGLPDLITLPLIAKAQLPRAATIGKYAEVWAAFQHDPEMRARIESFSKLMARPGPPSSPFERIGLPSAELFCAVSVLALHRAVCGEPLNNPNNKRAAAFCQALLSASHARARTPAPAKSSSWPYYFRLAHKDSEQATAARRVLDAVIEGAIAQAEMRQQAYANALKRLN